VVFGAIEPFGESSSSLGHERRFFASGARRGRFGGSLGPLRAWWLGMEQTFRETMLVNSAGYLRREHFEALGGYDISLDILEDVEFWSRAMQTFRTSYLSRTLLEYRITGTSLMHREKGMNLGDGAAAYRSMHDQYRRTHGRYGYLVAKGVARTVARLV
jgi:hypothetical protein